MSMTSARLTAEVLGSERKRCVQSSAGWLPKLAGMSADKKSANSKHPNDSGAASPSCMRKIARQFLEK